ncbi:hypothetical protein ACF0H5_003524 [Mactra antiquata]
MLSPASPISPTDLIMQQGVSPRSCKKKDSNSNYQRDQRENHSTNHYLHQEILRQTSRDSLDSNLQNRESDRYSRESTPRDMEERWELREIIRKDSRDVRESSDHEELEFLHERESSISSSISQTSSQRSSNTLPYQKKQSSSSSSDHRYITYRILYI